MSKLEDIRIKMDLALMSKSKSELNKLRQDTKLSFMEIYAAQNLQARLFASGRIPVEIAQFLYINLNKYDSLDLTSRYLVLQLIKELTQLEIKMRLSK